MSSAGPNYAQLFGIHSTAAAIVFIVLYIPLAIWFLVQLIRRPNFIFFFLHFFCLIRVAAFILRAILAASDSAAHTLSVLIAFEILSGVGFAGLLLPSYFLVLDKFLLLDTPPSGILALLRNRHLFRLVLAAGVAIGIVGSIDITSTSSSTVSLGQTLRKVGLIILFVLTVLQAFQTLMLVNLERKDSQTRRPQRGSRSFGERHGSYLLLGIAIFLLIREAFTIATISDITKQNNEHFWYPLVAVPEILAVICYAAPGLVPPRSELPK